MKKYYLLPLHDTRQSFYDKAVVVETENETQLHSYLTHVATCKNGEVKLLGYYSATTSRHQKEFFRQFDTTGRQFADVMRKVKG